ncbi:hypothetical protein EJ06DRAFT_509066 [Trichodelitschia bisporula]|uniref:Twin-arginine translocation pathway signal n=1 Tax=Trichodelitschia bisporula TaxID=703511 RepID=A0A6G1I021_9PEZI|nr:hypothetical protein EJ06DRAFT_509066 [Trichodelitschia bisporula]
MPGAGRLLNLALILASVASPTLAAPHRPRPQALEIRSPLVIRAAQEPAPAAATTAVATPGTQPGVAAPATPPAAPAAASNTTAAAPGGGLTDLDILQFALTLEHLESTFYQQGFAKFPDSDFAALGLSPDQITGLKQVGMTEQTHVTQLMSAISAAGAKPVEACTYNFGFTTAANMVGTARVLEAVGISAYLGAAPLIKSAPVLTAAAEIVTIEARHQTFIRTASKAIAVPNAFDQPLGPRAVFTLAAPFIQSCPAGSNLNVQAFPAIALSGGGTNIQAGQSLVLADPQQPVGAQFCAFLNQGQTVFQQIQGGGCGVPQGLTGEVYMIVTKSASIADTEILAGPSVILMT